MRTWLLYLPIGFGALFSGTPISAQLGTLHEGAALEARITDVRAEVVLFFPVGQHALLESSVRAPSDGPEDTQWASLLFIAADTLRVGAREVADYGAGPTMAAVWIEEERELTDPRTQGFQSDAEARIWYEDESVAAELREMGLSAAASRVRVLPRSDGWSFELSTADYRISGECVFSGPREEIEYETPAFVTVPHGSEPTSFFWVYTFAGHHVQPCVVEGLQLSGDDALVGALRAAAASENLFANVQDGWHARAALYRTAVRRSR